MRSKDRKSGGPRRLRIEGYELSCPVCDVLTPPRQLAGVSLNECGKCRGLWVFGESFDVCPNHGTWLDADELEQVAGFILSGGSTSPLLEVEPRRIADSRDAVANPLFAAEIGPPRSERGLVTSLVDVLTTLFT